MKQSKEKTNVIKSNQLKKKDYFKIMKNIDNK